MVVALDLLGQALRETLQGGKGWRWHGDQYGEKERGKAKGEEKEKGGEGETETERDHRPNSLLCLNPPPVYCLLCCFYFC